MKLFYKALLPVLLLSSTATFAQRNFKDGYIVNMKGDTLRGAIDFQDWENNPALIRFRAANGTVTDQTPANTKAFYVPQGGLYRTFTVNISHDVTSITRPTYTVDTAKTAATVFLKRLVTGKNIDLYAFHDNARKRFIVLDKKEGIPKELTFHFYIINAVQTVVNTYRNQLGYYTQVYSIYNDRMLARLEGVTYDEQGITPIINSINGAVSYNDVKIDEPKAKPQKVVKQKVSDDDPDKKPIVTMFAGVGLNSATLLYYGYNDLAENPKKNSTVLPQASFGIDFARDPDVSRLVVRLELSVYSGKLNAQSANAEKSADIFAVSVKPQLIYNLYVQDKLKVFVSSGFYYTFGSTSNLVYTVTNPRYNLINGQQPFYDKWLNIPARAGVLVNKRFEIYASYLFPADMERGGALSYSTDLRFWQAGINYHFR